MIDARELGAAGDGTSHPLSLTFASLEEARAAYPLAEIESLAEERDGAALQQAIGRVQQLMEAGEPAPSIRLAAGRYVLSRPLVFRPALKGVIAGGVRLVGEGPFATVLVHGGSGPAMEISALPQRADGTGFVRFAAVEGIGFQAPRGAGLRIHRCLDVRLTDVSFLRCGSAGLQLASDKGDPDAPNNILLVNCEFEACRGWGLDAKAAPGKNEIGNLTLINCRFSQCGAPGGAGGPPESGGMRWKGQVLTLINCLFAQNQNGGLVIPGEAGLAANATLLNCTFENNTRRAIYCSGIDSFLMQRGTIRSSLPQVFPAACGIEIDAAFAVKGFVVDGPRVQARPGLGDYEFIRAGGRNGGHGAMLNAEFYDFDEDYTRVGRGAAEAFAFGFDFVDKGRRSAQRGALRTASLSEKRSRVALDPTISTEWLIVLRPGAEQLELAYPRAEFLRRSTDGPGMKLSVKIINESGRPASLAYAPPMFFRGRALPSSVRQSVDLQFLLRFVEGTGLVFEQVVYGPED